LSLCSSRTGSCLENNEAQKTQNWRERSPEQE